MTQDQDQDQAQIQTGHAVEMQPVCIEEREMTLEELMAEREALDGRIKLAVKLQRPADLATCRKLISLHGFGARELGIADSAGVAEALPIAAHSATEPKKLPVKYRNAETGDTWTGRGIQPKWLQQALAEGKSLADFLVPAEVAEAEA